MYGCATHYNIDKAFHNSLVWSRTRIGYNVSYLLYVTCCQYEYREKANLAITLTNGTDGGEIMGHGALYDYPNVVTDDNWVHWLSNNYDVSMATV